MAKNDHAIQTVTVSKDVPTTDIKVDLMPRWASYITVGNEVVVTNFVLNHMRPGMTEMQQGADGKPVLPVMQCNLGSAGAADLCAGMGGWSFGAEKLECKTGGGLPSSC